MSNTDSRPIFERLCGNCGQSDRHANGHCRLCTREEIKAWKLANPERQKQIDADWKEVIKAKNRIYSKERYASNPEHQKAASEKWRLANQERATKSASEWKRLNREKYNATAAIYRENNKDKIRAYHSKYKKENRSRLKAIDHNYRTKKSNNGGKLSKGIVEKLLKLQKGKCACCGQPLGKNYHVDHIKPIALGGPNIDSNVQLLRQRCNNQKGKKDPLQFMQERGFLL